MYYLIVIQIIVITFLLYLFIFLGILSDIQKQFIIGDDKGGLLQTAFVISYMICAPIFGYLGDRYNRKLIMAFGVFLWSLTTFVGSYMNVSTHDVQELIFFLINIFFPGILFIFVLSELSRCR